MKTDRHNRLTIPRAIQAQHQERQHILRHDKVGLLAEHQRVKHVKFETVVHQATFVLGQERGVTVALSGS